jgi:hypothetical protein
MSRHVPVNAVNTVDAVESPDYEYKYWAFISYSHRDERWARWLHHALETYRIPKRLNFPTSTRGGGPANDRIYPVFRDRDELSGGFDLSERITAALKQSRFLIVICSPSASKSRHVCDEIDTFESLGREHRVLCFIVDGEPGASSSPGPAAAECLPPPVRTRRTRDGALVPCEPIAADVREGKDGRTNAKLKLIAEMLEVPFDVLKQREGRRRLRRRLQLAGATLAVCVAALASYLLALDAGFRGPGGTTLRRVADRHGMSLLRPVPANAIVADKARELSTRLAQQIVSARKGDWLLSNPNDGIVMVWSHAQGLFGLLSAPDATVPAAEWLAPLLTAPFTSDQKIERDAVKYGWLAESGDPSPMAPPTLWTAMSLAAALRVDPFPTAGARAQTRAHFEYVQEALDPYHTDTAGGWTLFAYQVDRSDDDPYATTLALMALLETRRAGLPWRGSVERRDALIRHAAAVLIKQFDARRQPPGWMSGNQSLVNTSEGLTLQIYGRLLDARSQMGLAIPPPIAAEIPRLLMRIAENGREFGSDNGEYSIPIRLGLESVNVKDSVYFLSYPWAIDCAARWLASEDAHTAPIEDRVAIERELAHLVVDLGNQASSEAEKGGTFYSAEMLYGLSAVRGNSGR